MAAIAKNIDDLVKLFQAYVDKVIPEVRPPCYSLADSKALTNFSGAIGDNNPLWRDPMYAIETRWETLMAPPMFPVAARYPVPAIYEPGPRGVDVVYFYKGLEMEFYDAIRLMDELSSEKKLISVEKKEGKFGLYEGAYAKLTAETMIWNHHRELVCKMKGRSLALPRPTEGKLFFEQEIHSYSDEEVARIGKEIEDESRAGDRMPLWDDVNVGDKLIPTIKSPMTLNAMLNCEMALIGWPYRGYVMNYYDMLADPNTSIVHPIMRFRVPKTQTSDSVISKELGMPINWSPGILTDSMIGHLLANWMGDDGFVRKVSSKTKYPYFYGDALWWNGEVTDKKQTAEGNTVEVAFKANNQLDIEVTEGTATVLLPSQTCKKVNLPIPC